MPGRNLTPGLQYPTIRHLVAPQLDDTVRNIYDNLFYIRGQLAKVAQLPSSNVPDIQQVTITTGAAGGTNVIVNTHAIRLATTPTTVGDLFYEYDRGSLYIVSASTGVNLWTFAAGGMQAALSAIPTDLSTQDTGFIFVNTDAAQNTEYVWNGTGWWTIGGYLQTGEFLVSGDISWKSGTSFTGTFRHNNSANRTYDFPDESVGIVNTTTTLTASEVVLGSGAAKVHTLGDLGSTTELLHGNVSGDPYWAAVDFSTDIININVNLETQVSGVLPEANGGTGSTTGPVYSGNPGGVIYFNTSSTIDSSAELVIHRIVIGGGQVAGAGSPPYTLGSSGTATTVLHGSASGDPSFGAVVLTADVSGILPVPNGGTGASTLTTSAILLGTGASAIHGVSGLGTTSTVLHGNAAGDPSFGAVVLTADVSGILPVANGGTGASSLTASAILLGSGTSAIHGVGLGTTTTVLHGNAAGDPSFGAVVLTADVSGILPIANGGTAASTAAGARSNLGAAAAQAPGSHTLPIGVDGTFSFAGDGVISAYLDPTVTAADIYANTFFELDTGTYPFYTAGTQWVSTYIGYIYDQIYGAPTTYFPDGSLHTYSDYIGPNVQVLFDFATDIYFGYVKYDTPIDDPGPWNAIADGVTSVDGFGNGISFDGDGLVVYADGGFNVGGFYYTSGSGETNLFVQAVDGSTIYQVLYNDGIGDPLNGYLYILAPA